MSYNGIVRKMDPLGRIVIPIEARKTLEWFEGTPISITPFGSYVLLRGVDDQNAGGQTALPLNNPVALEIKEAMAKLDESDLLLVLQMVQRLTQSSEPDSAPRQAG